MKKVVWIVILLLVGLRTTAQGEKVLFNIRGERVEIPDGVQPFVVFYSPYSCHNCMYDLIDYMGKLERNDSRFKFYVMIPGRDVATMRYATAGLDEFFSKDSMPTVVYDLNEDTSLRYEARYDVKHYPCLFLFDKDGRCHYLSYGTLFKEGVSVNREMLNETIRGL